MHCQSQWRWVASATWVLMLPPLPRTEAGWWNVVSQWFGGWRHGPRHSVELHAPRLTRRRTPPVAIYPVVSNVAPATPAPVLPARRIDETT